jgi:hypothetical protein
MKGTMKKHVSLLAQGIVHWNTEAAQCAQKQIKTLKGSSID